MGLFSLGGGNRNPLTTPGGPIAAAAPSLAGGIASAAGGGSLPVPGGPFGATPGGSPLAMHNGGVVPGDSSAGDVPVLLQPGETVVPVSGRRLPPGYAPGPEKVTNDFGTKAVGGHMSGVIGDLSFPRTAGMMPRGGPVCKTCYLPPSDHVTPAAQAGYSPLQSVPGIHPDVDDPTETRNSADVLAESRNAAFYGSAG